MTISNEEPNAVAVLALLNAGNASAYDSDALKELPTLPANYNEVTVERRFGGQARAVGSTTRRGWRITVRSVGIVIDNAREMRRLADVEGARLVVDGKTSTPIQFESADPIGEDDGRWSGLTTYTYAI